jgi:uridine kinase
MARDCAERGRTPEQVLAQYHKTVRPMHEEWVEPSKKVADLVVHSTGHSMDVAVQILANHMRVTAGIDSPTTAATTEEA